jgi:quercetin dioxygenase-like cupin family protein
VAFSVNTNIRSGPSSSYRVIGSLGSGDTASANGRSADSLWLRIQLPNSEIQGWVFANAVTSGSDLSQLSVVASGAMEVAYQPMQAFYFQTGIGQTSCVEAPQDGILIQTPSGAGTVNLRANDVDVQLGSTVFLQAQPGGVLTITVIEGQAIISANGKTVTVPAGSYATVPMDDAMHVAGRPSEATPYVIALLLTLPIQLLPEQITIAPPASQETILTSNLPTFDLFQRGATGISGSISSLVALPLDQFCIAMDQAAGQANMSRANYKELLSSAAAAATGAERTMLTQASDRLSSCP